MIAAMAAHTHAHARVGPHDVSPTHAVRGLAMRLTLEHAGRPVKARPDQSPDSPLTVRVLPGTGTSQTIEFVGTVAGAFDLRDALVHEDGADASDLAPLPVIIETRLTPGADSDVLGLAKPVFSLEAHYREALVAVAAAWVLVPVVAITRRALRRAAPTPPPPPSPREPTTQERLRTLIDACLANEDDTELRAALELLWLRCCREAVSDRDEEIASAMTRLRRDDRAKAVVLALEAWLHAPRGADSRAGSLDSLRAAMRAAEGDAP